MSKKNIQIWNLREKPVLKMFGLNFSSALPASKNSKTLATLDLPGGGKTGGAHGASFSFFSFSMRYSCASIRGGCLENTFFSLFGHVCQKLRRNRKKIKYFGIDE